MPLRFPPTTLATSPSASRTSSRLTVSPSSSWRSARAMRSAVGRAVTTSVRHDVGPTMSTHACTGRRSAPRGRRRLEQARLAVDHGGEEVLGDGQDALGERVPGVDHASSLVGRSPSMSSLPMSASGVNGDEVLVGTGGERAHDARLLGLRGDHHEREVAPLAARADGLHELQPVHDRHVPVDARELEALARLEQVERLASVTRLGGLEAEIPQRRGDDAAHHAGVVDDQRSHALPPRVGRWSPA